MFFSLWHIWYNFRMDNITLKMDEIKLVFSGLHQNYTFSHISDTHLAVASENSSPEERQMAETRTRFWTPSSGILPIDLCFRSCSNNFCLRKSRRRYR